MTELNLETVVLCGANVACDNVASQRRMASEEAGHRDRMVVPSFQWLLSSKPAQPESDAGPRYTAMLGGAVAPRAGRLAALSGDRVSRPRHPSTRWLSPTRQAKQIRLQQLRRIGPAAKQLPVGTKPTGRGMQALRGR